MKLRCNVCNNATVKEECNMQCKAERCSLIIVLNLILFWVMSFLRTDYISETVFYDVNSAVIIIKQAFSIKFINNDLSAAWESEMWKGSISSLKRLNKYNCVYMQQQSLCCCLFYAIILFRMCISSLLCRHFVNRFILRHLHFLYLIFIFILFCFCISFQQSKYVNNVTYNTHYILD
jgi:hypothetical protein